MKKSLRNILKKQAQAPRALVDIQKAYMELANKAGQVQYQVYVYTKELAEVNKALEALNHEGAARQKLDAEAKDTRPEETKSAEVVQEPAQQQSGAV
jgi:hypothetical protein